MAFRNGCSSAQAARRVARKFAPFLGRRLHAAGWPSIVIWSGAEFAKHYPAESRTPLAAHAWRCSVLTGNLSNFVDKCQTIDADERALAMFACASTGRRSEAGDKDARGWRGQMNCLAERRGKVQCPADAVRDRTRRSSSITALDLSYSS